MKCRQIQKSFSDYLDGTLDSTKMESVREHLVDCQPCRTEWQAFQATVSQLHTLPQIPVSEDFDAKMRERLRQATPAEKRSRWDTWWPFQVRVAIPALMLLIVIGAIGSYLSYHPDWFEAMRSPKESVVSNTEDEDATSQRNENERPLFRGVDDPLAVSDIESPETTNYVLHTVSYNDSRGPIGF